MAGSDFHIMATRCPKCGKKPITGTTRVLLRGHYNPTATRRQHINLQWAKVDGKRMKLCTDCIKGLHKAQVSA